MQDCFNQYLKRYDKITRKMNLTFIIGDIRVDTRVRGFNFKNSAICRYISKYMRQESKFKKEKRNNILYTTRKSVACTHPHTHTDLFVTRIWSAAFFSCVISGRCDFRSCSRRGRANRSWLSAPTSSSSLTTSIALSHQVDQSCHRYRFRHCRHCCRYRCLRFRFSRSSNSPWLRYWELSCYFG